jgi:hypothetical protein
MRARNRKLRRLGEDCWCVQTMCNVYRLFLLTHQRKHIDISTMVFKHTRGVFNECSWNIMYIHTTYLDNGKENMLYITGMNNERD